MPGAKEGEIAVPLAEIARSFERLSIGSYPWFNSPEDTGVSIVARGQSTSEIENESQQQGKYTKIRGGNARHGLRVSERVFGGLRIGS